MADKAEPILGIDDLLGRFRSDGETESSGTFTLDPKKALERLAQFQLPGQYHWILKVIQCLHLSGARTIKIEAGVHKVLLTADVVPKGFDSVDDLLTQLLADAADAKPSLRHLAAGLQGCLAVQPSQIRMLTIADGEAREYVLKAGGWRDGGKGPSPLTGEHFELRLVRNLAEKLSHSWFLLNTDIFDLLFGRRGSLDRENKVVFELCDYSQSEILLGSRSVNACKFGRPRFAGYDIRSDPDPANAKPSVIKTWLTETDLVDNVAHVQHHLAEMVVPNDKPGGFRLESISHATWTNRNDESLKAECEVNGLSRAYGLRMDLAPLAAVWFWDDGVIIGRQTLPVDCPGMVAMVNARDLGKDLTTLQVLDDSRLSVVKEEVKAAAQVLRQKVKENLHLMPAQGRIQSQLRL